MAASGPAEEAPPRRPGHIVQIGKQTLVYGLSGVSLQLVGLITLPIFARDPVEGALHQLAGRAGCVRDGGGRGCARGRGLASATSVVISRKAHRSHAKW